MHRVRILLAGAAINRAPRDPRHIRDNRAGHYCRPGMAPYGGGNLRTGIAARAEVMEGFQLCARCGVDHFTQRPVRRRG